MPMTIMRGMCALPAKKHIRDRYLRSRKEKLILLVVSDLDPAGDAIAADLLKSFRPDFGIEDIEVYKVALTIKQVREFDLAPSMEAKANSPTYRAPPAPPQAAPPRFTWGWFSAAERKALRAALERARKRRVAAENKFSSKVAPTVLTSLQCNGSKRINFG